MIFTLLRFRNAVLEKYSPPATRVIEQPSARQQMAMDVYGRQIEAICSYHTCNHKFQYMVIAVVNANVAILLIMHYGNQFPRQQKLLTVNTMETAFELIRRNSEVTELKCFICGMKTGCNECEYLTECEQRIVSKYCICKGYINLRNYRQIYYNTSYTMYQIDIYKFSKGVIYY